MQQDINSLEKKLDAFFVRAKDTDDEELKSDLANFGAVLVCGYVEQCVKLVILSRLSTTVPTRVLEFIKSHFRQGSNYKSGAIVQLLNRFDPKWGELFHLRISNNDQWSGSLVSAYDLRNSIAHGGSATIGLKRAESLYTDCKSIVAALVEATNN